MSAAQIKVSPSLYKLTNGDERQVACIHAKERSAEKIRCKSTRTAGRNTIALFPMMTIFKSLCKARAYKTY